MSTGEPLKLASADFDLGHGGGAHASDEHDVIGSANPKVQGFDGAAPSLAQYRDEPARQRRSSRHGRPPGSVACRRGDVARAGTAPSTRTRP